MMCMECMIHSNLVIILLANNLIHEYCAVEKRGDTTVSQAYYIYIHARFLPMSAFYTLHLGIKLMATYKFQSGVS